ncbi:MAG: hypothetical protein RL211_72 [Pseudomonadota bacterium]|jgi:hypothetical protein
MPTAKTIAKKAAFAAKMAALPHIPPELVDLFVKGPMTGEAVNAVSMAFKKALIERASRSHFTVPYEAIMLTPFGEPMAATGATPASSAQTKPSPPPEIARREDFRIGNRVSFTDRDLQQRVGLIVRINQRTATLDCDGQTWRVAFGLLRHLVDI